MSCWYNIPSHSDRWPAHHRCPSKPVKTVAFEWVAQIANYRPPCCNPYARGRPECGDWHQMQIPPMTPNRALHCRLASLLCDLTSNARDDPMSSRHGPGHKPLDMPWPSSQIHRLCQGWSRGCYPWACLTFGLGGSNGPKPLGHLWQHANVRRRIPHNIHAVRWNSR